MENMIETLNTFLTNLLTTVTDLSGYAVVIAVVYLIVQFVMYLVPWIVGYMGLRIVATKLHNWATTPKVTHTHMKTSDLEGDIEQNCITRTGDAPAIMRRVFSKLRNHHNSTYIFERHAEWLEDVIDAAIAAEKTKGGD